MRRGAFVLSLVLLVSACQVGGAAGNSNQPDPEWEVFRATATNEEPFAGKSGYQPSEGSFTFNDLKHESDASLARRLLGAVGERIVFVDRRRDRWQYYDGDSDPIESIDLYSIPESWGSAFGICRTEKYEITFSDGGKIESVAVKPHYGVEGPIFQRSNFDWDDFYNRMCARVPANHTPSYFPAEDVLEAHDLAILLSKAIFLAGQEGDLPFAFSCETYDGKECAPGIREFFSKLRLSEIDETKTENCPDPQRTGDHCFTVTVGQHRLGPHPKFITVRGSTYLNNWVVYGVGIREGFTIS